MDYSINAFGQIGSHLKKKKNSTYITQFAMLGRSKSSIILIVKNNRRDGPTSSLDVTTPIPTLRKRLKAKNQQFFLDPSED